MNILPIVWFEHSKDEGELVERPEDEIWVGRDEDVHSLAVTIVQYLENGDEYVDMACIGAASVNQAVKATAVARAKVEEKDQSRTLVMMSGFSTIVDEEGLTKTRIMLRVLPVRLDSGEALSR